MFPEIYKIMPEKSQENGGENRNTKEPATIKPGGKSDSSSHPSSGTKLLPCCNT